MEIITIETNAPIESKKRMRVSSDSVDFNNIFRQLATVFEDVDINFAERRSMEVLSFPHVTDLL